MHKRRALLILFLSLPGAPTFAQTQPGWLIEAPGGVRWDLNTGRGSATNGVTVKYENATLTAQRAFIDQASGNVAAEGNVRIEREGNVWVGDKVSYNFKTGQALGGEFKTASAPFFTRGEALVGDQKNEVYVVGDGLFSTDDYAEPGYSIHAKSIVVLPGEYIEARHARLYFGSVPVFYYPYFRKSLKRHPNNWVLTPGYRSRFGPYLLTSYNWYWNERLEGSVHIDGYARRGVGVGPDFTYHLPALGDGTFKYYYVHDSEPNIDNLNVPVDTDRQRVWFLHQATLATNLTAKVVARWQSDALVVRDFFESEYRKNSQPNSFLEVNKVWPNFTLDLYAQPRLNSFQETVERLPDVKLTGLRQRIFETPLYYESDSSLGWYRRRFAYDASNAYSAFRADTYHQLLLPWNFFGWLNVTPRVGGRFSHYGETTGLGTTLNERDRGVFNTGAEISTKASRVWSEARNRFFQIDGLRHIIEPSINYAYVPRPNRTPAELPQFDYEIASPRLLPIDFPDYNSIDSIDSRNVMRLTLRNRLQTKRRQQIENAVNWALYTDWRLKPNTGQSTFSDIFSDLDLKPFRWLLLSSELRFGLDDHRWHLANNTVTFSPNDKWGLSVGHRYTAVTEQFGTNFAQDVGLGSLYYRLNDNWGARVTEYYDARLHLLQEQHYTIYHDFRSWTGALTLRVRKQVTGPVDYTVAATFSLKAYPRFELGEDSHRPERLLGY